MHRFAIAFVVLFAAPFLFAQHFAEVGDGVRLWYSDTGKGSPIIVIHGGPGMDHDSLSADLAPLRARHRLLEYDQRGGGRSTLPADVALLTIDHHVADLEALRKHLGLEKVTLLAHSFGPAIAARYAIRYPDRIERMIFLSPIPPVKGKFFEEYGATLTTRLTPDQLKRAGELQKALDSADATTACREYWSIMTPPRLAKSVPVSVVKSDLCAAPPEAIRFGMTKTNPATFGSLGDWNWTSELARVKAPVMIIHGEEDAIPMAMVSNWVTALPNARILRLPHTGHFPHAEQPAIVFRAIEEFLKGGWPKGAVGK
ncbi:MAG: proline iminopeptidase [Thermoanaerobaculia bacterium]|jgi:proline iminopeptidase|nr:proline iminopeptidase [Thermoanaerobaculia bacterium]